MTFNCRAIWPQLGIGRWRRWHWRPIQTKHDIESRLLWELQTVINTTYLLQYESRLLLLYQLFSQITICTTYWTLVTFIQRRLSEWFCCSMTWKNIIRHPTRNDSMLTSFCSCFIFTGFSNSFRLASSSLFLHNILNRSTMKPNMGKATISLLITTITWVQQQSVYSLGLCRISDPASSENRPILQIWPKSDSDQNVADFGFWPDLQNGT